MRDSEIIAEAQRLIDTPDKWVKGCLHDTVQGVDRYCMVGAVHTVFEAAEPTFDVKRYYRLLSRLAGVINEQFPERNATLVPVFNDDPATTHDEVMAVMTKTRINIEGEGN